MQIIWRSTKSTSLLAMDSCILISHTACMGCTVGHPCKKWLKKDQKIWFSDKRVIRQDFSGTTRVPSNFHWWWMILVCTTYTKRIHIFYHLSSRTTTRQFWNNRKETLSVESRWIGNTKSALWGLLYWALSKIYNTSIRMSATDNQNTHHMPSNRQALKKSIVPRERRLLSRAHSITNKRISRNHWLAIILCPFHWWYIYCCTLWPLISADHRHGGNTKIFMEAIELL